ncbi:MAG: nucleoid-associated protein [Bacteroidales bacterium]|nr:nucleoid-associated protein [Bacteroidales bacterium]
MPIFEASSVSRVALHRVGNKETDEGYVLSGREATLTEALQDLLVRYLISPFKVEEYYHLWHEDGLEMNALWTAARAIFSDPESLLEESQHIARHLYDACTHPNIKSGDLFVVYFSQCQLNGESMDALGIFKSENKSQFLKVMHDEEEWSREAENRSSSAVFRMEIDKGIDIGKLDKGALIFNSEGDKGFVVSVVDTTNRGMDAIYWKDNFLGVKQRQDEYYNTHQVMQAYKKFVTDELPTQFQDVSRADQADLLNRSVDFFKQNDIFEMSDFERDVLGQEEVIESFKQYREQFEEEHGVEIADSFAISEGAVKKQARSYKSVIKLDKNFHIYVHGDRRLIEQGEDEKGKFYKVYYEEES